MAIEAFQPLFAQAGWTTKVTPLDAPTLAMLGWLSRDEGLVADSASGQWLAARRKGERGSVQVTAIRFASEERAQQALAARTARRRKLVEKPTELRTLRHALTEGAGPDSRLPGSYYVVGGGGSMPGLLITRHLFRHETLLVDLQVMNTPAFDRDVQDGFVEHVVARIEQPERPRDPPPVPHLVRTTRDLVVRVVDPEGRPVPRARVAFAYGDRGGRLSARYGDCVDGVCEITVPLGRGTLYVRRATTVDEMPLPLGPARVRVRAEQDETTVRLPHGLSIAGRVLAPDGEPAANVTVLARRDKTYAPFGTWFDLQTDTDANGDFRLDGLAKGAHKMRVVQRDGTQGRLGPVPGGGEPGRRLRLKRGTVEVEAGRHDVVLELADSATLRVRVVGPDGDAVPGALVSVRGRTGVVPKTDRNGELELAGLDPGKPAHLTVTPPRGTDLAQSSVTALPAERVKTVPLQKGWRLQGVVRSRDGKRMKAKVRRRTGSRSIQTTTTDEQGNFEFRGLPMEPVFVEATNAKGGFGPFTKHHWIEVAPTDKTIELRCDAPDTVTVRVLGPDGHEVPIWQGCIGTTDGGFLTSTYRGTVVIDRPRSLHVFGFRDANGEPLGYAPQIWKTTPDTSEVTLRLEPGSALRGHVLDTLGRPVPDIEVWASHAESGSEHATARTNERGAFTLLGLLSEPYEIGTRPAQPRAAGLPEKHTVTRDTKLIELRLPDPVKVTVVDPEGAPVPGASVTLRVTDVKYWYDALHMRTDQNGVVYVGDVKRGTSLFVVPPPTHRDLRSKRTVWFGKPTTVTLEPRK